MKKICSKNEVLSLLAKSGFISVLLILLAHPAFSQNAGKDSAVLNEKSLSEELYVKTDRDLYISGEQVWIKISRFNNLTNTPSTLSKIVYVDLLDTYNNPVMQLKIGTEGSTGSGVMTLPDTLSTGNYIIRAYTNWMKNFSRDLFSYKKISVINPFKNITSIKVPSSDLFPDSVIFFPEGGQLIKEVESKLGFRSFNKSGYPVALKGVLTDENNDTICSMSASKNGYGWVVLNPASTKRLYLLTTIRGQQRRFPLPEVKEEGITILVATNGSNQQNFITIKKTNNAVNPGQKMFLRLQSESFTDSKKEVNPVSNTIVVGKKDLPPGLSYLTVTDEENNQLAERWIYNEADNLINFTINIQNGSPGPREPIIIDVSATDNTGAPVESNFSVSVIKAFTVNKNSFNNNKYRQLPGLPILTADNSHPDVNDYLIFYPGHDLTLKYEGKESDRLPAYLPELEGHLISGNIKDRRSSEPLRNENISLSFVGKTALCLFTKTNEHGDFHFVTYEKGRREIVIQPVSSKTQNTYVELYNPFISTFKKYDHEIFTIDKNLLDDINNAIISMQIKNIYEPFMLKPTSDNITRESNDFYGEPDNTILMSKYIELTSLKEVVKEIIPGVSTTRKNDSTNFKLVYKYNSNPFENSPLVLVDGVPLYDVEKVLNLSSKDIELIDVLTTRYFIADNVLDGVLHFVTKNGDLRALDFDRSVFRIEYEMVQKNNKFYSMDYSSDSLKNSRIPDFRNTLYWSPDNHTDKNGKTTIGFYASDEAVEYLINIEGFTSDGKKGSANFPLKIISK